jgi:hypothetical protein
MPHGKILLVSAILVSLFMMAMNAATRAQNAPATPQVQALSQRLMGEINANLQCNAAAIEGQQQLAVANAEVKRLTDKYEPKAAEGKKPAEKK